MFFRRKENFRVYIKHLRNAYSCCYLLNICDLMMLLNICDEKTKLRASSKINPKLFTVIDFIWNLAKVAITRLAIFESRLQKNSGQARQFFHSGIRILSLFKAFLKSNGQSCMLCKLINNNILIFVLTEMIKFKSARNYLLDTHKPQNQHIMKLLIGIACKETEFVL